MPFYLQPADLPFHTDHSNHSHNEKSNSDHNQNSNFQNQFHMNPFSNLSNASAGNTAPVFPLFVPALPAKQVPIQVPMFAPMPLFGQPSTAPRFASVQVFVDPRTASYLPWHNGALLLSQLANANPKIDMSLSAKPTNDLNANSNGNNNNIAIKAEPHAEPLGADACLGKQKKLDASDHELDAEPKRKSVKKTKGKFHELAFCPGRVLNELCLSRTEKNYRKFSKQAPEGTKIKKRQCVHCEKFTKKQKMELETAADRCFVVDPAAFAQHTSPVQRKRVPRAFGNGVEIAARAADGSQNTYLITKLYLDDARVIIGCDSAQHSSDLRAVLEDHNVATSPCSVSCFLCLRCNQMRVNSTSAAPEGKFLCGNCKHLTPSRSESAVPSAPTVAVPVPIVTSAPAKQ